MLDSLGLLPVRVQVTQSGFEPRFSAIPIPILLAVSGHIKSRFLLVLVLITRDSPCALPASLTAYLFQCPSTPKRLVSLLWHSVL